MRILNLLTNILDSVGTISKELGRTLLSYYHWLDTTSAIQVSYRVCGIYQDDVESLLITMKFLDDYSTEPTLSDEFKTLLAELFYITARNPSLSKHPDFIARFYKKSAELGHQKGVIEYILFDHNIEGRKAKLATFAQLPPMVKEAIALFISLEQSDIAFQELLPQCDPIFSDPTQNPKIALGYYEGESIIASIRARKAILDKNPSLAKAIYAEVISASMEITKVQESLMCLFKYGYIEEVKNLLDEITDKFPKTREDLIVKCFTILTTKYENDKGKYEALLKNIARYDTKTYNSPILAIEELQEDVVMTAVLSFVLNNNLALASEYLKYLTQEHQGWFEGAIRYFKACSHAKEPTTDKAVLHDVDETTVVAIEQPLRVQKPIISLPNDPQEFLHSINAQWDSEVIPEPEVVKLYFAVIKLLHEQSFKDRFTHTKDRAELLSTWCKGGQCYQSQDSDVYPISNKPGFYVAIDRDLRADLELKAATSHYLQKAKDVHRLGQNGVKFFENIIECKIPGDSRLYTKQIHLDTKTGNYIIILDHAGNHKAIAKEVIHGHGPQIVSLYDVEPMLYGAKAAAEEWPIHHQATEYRDDLSLEDAFHSIASQMLGADNIKWVSEYDN